MTASQLRRIMLIERACFPKHSPDWAWRTKAARTYTRLILGIPVNRWRD